MLARHDLYQAGRPLAGVCKENGNNFLFTKMSLTFWLSSYSSINIKDLKKTRTIVILCLFKSNGRNFFLNTYIQYKPSWWERVGGTFSWVFLVAYKRDNKFNSRIKWNLFVPYSACLFSLLSVFNPSVFLTEFLS